MEKSNLKLNDLTSSLSHLDQSKTISMNKINKKSNITLPLSLPDQIKYKNERTNLEEHTISINKPIDLDEDEDDNENILSEIEEISQA